MRVRTGLLFGIATSVLIAGCATGTDRTNPDGDWVGVLQTTAGDCPDGEPSDLVVSDREITFVPGDGVLALKGRRGSDPDALHAQLQGTDMNHKPLPMVFDGRFTEGRIEGTYGTPTCRGAITMHRPTHTALQRLLGH